MKEAFETLSDATKRKSYDSTIDFDDSIPAASDVKSEPDFYKVFGDCFERNLRFAAENDPDQKAAAAARKMRSKGRKGKNKKQAYTGPPSFGDENSNINDVHEFYAVSLSCIILDLRILLVNSSSVDVICRFTAETNNLFNLLFLASLSVLDRISVLERLYLGCFKRNRT